MTERVQKLLAAAGLCSRRTAEEWIAAGRVTVNGQAAHIGDKADPETDTVAVDGRPVGRAAGHVYIMLHKPRGYVTTLSDERGRRTAAELVKDCGVRVYPVGRLDMYSEGLLILTDDGDAANRLMHPSHRVEKTYIVDVVGENLWAAVRQMRKEMEIDGVPVQAIDVQLIRSGGGSMLYGSDRMLEDSTHIRTMIVDDPLACAAHGAGKLLTKLDTMQDGMMNFLRNREMRN